RLHATTYSNAPVIPSGARDLAIAHPPHKQRSVINQLVGSFTWFRTTLRHDEGLIRLHDDESQLSRALYRCHNSLERRLWFHGNASARSFTKKHNVDRLVYYERFDRPSDAISREKEIKGWRREKKNDLVLRLNPKWQDLGEKLFAGHRRGPSLRSG